MATVPGTLLPLCKLCIISNTTYRLHLYYNVCRREIEGKILNIKIKERIIENVKTTIT